MNISITDTEGTILRSTSDGWEVVIDGVTVSSGTLRGLLADPPITKMEVLRQLHRCHRIEEPTIVNKYRAIINSDTSFFIEEILNHYTDSELIKLIEPTFNKETFAHLNMVNRIKYLYYYTGDLTIDDILSVIGETNYSVMEQLIRVLLPAINRIGANEVMSRVLDRFKSHGGNIIKVILAVIK